MSEPGPREQTVREALELLTAAMDRFAVAYAAWAVDPALVDAGARLAIAEAQVVAAREALEALERALDGDR